MKIHIPNKIQTSHGEVEIPNIPARTAFEKGLVEGWKAATRRIYGVLTYDDIEFIEGEK